MQAPGTVIVGELEEKGQPIYIVAEDPDLDPNDVEENEDY